MARSPTSYYKDSPCLRPPNTPLLPCTASSRPGACSRDHILPTSTGTDNCRWRKRWNRRWKRSGT